MTEESSSAVDKTQCPKCAETGGDSSGDNLVVYSDGHGHCFACGHHTSNFLGDSMAPPSTPPTRSKKVNAKDIITGGSFERIAARGLTADTCEFLNYQIGEDHKGQPVQIANYITDGKIVGQKLRYKDKKFMTTGDFKSVGLYGQHKFRDGGKRLVITEGEIDALSVSQLQGNKWPVVSVPNGAAGAAKAIAKNIEWIEKFDAVVFAFDMDEPGQSAARECAALLSPGKAFIATLPMKDANECLKNDKGKELIDSLWGAKAYRPDGLVSIDDIMDEAEKPVETGLPWCFPTLTKLTYGRRFGEIYGLGAGTGIGKTDVFTQQIAFDVETLKLPVGVVYLEQKPVETAKRIAGKLAGKRFHVPDTGWTREEQRAALQQLRGNVTFYDNFGETDWDIVKAKIRYMAVGLGIKLVYLDHLTAMADTTNERESIEQLMKEMAGLANELGIIIHFISHLATPEGKPHEEGGRVMIRHFKGSRSIGFWSFFMFGLERNQQSDDPDEQKLTVFRCLKDRYTGQSTGKTFGLTYDVETGRLFECALPEGGGDKPMFQPHAPQRPPVEEY
jgi:twinkle protein